MMAPLDDRDEQAEEPADPGVCPRCASPAVWIPVDDERRGRGCRSCGWVELPQVVVERHNVNTMLRRMFPRHRFATLIDYLILSLRYGRRGDNHHPDDE